MPKMNYGREMGFRYLFNTDIFESGAPPPSRHLSNVIV